MSRAAVALAVLFALAGCTRAALDRDLGGRCATDADCSARCLPRPDWPGGFCTRPCRADADCPTGAVCPPTMNLCLFSCFDDPDCNFLGDGWTCRAAAGALVCSPSALPDAGARDAT